MGIEHSHYFLHLIGLRRTLVEPRDDAGIIFLSSELHKHPGAHTDAILNIGRHLISEFFLYRKREYDLYQHNCAKLTKKSHKTKSNSTPAALIMPDEINSGAGVITKPFIYKREWTVSYDLHNS